MKLFYEVPSKILEVLLNNDDIMNQTEITDLTGTRYTYTVKTIGNLVDDGFLEAEKNGREKLVNLTERGREMAKIVEMGKEMESGEKNV